MQGENFNQSASDAKAQPAGDANSQSAQHLSQQVFKDADDFFKTLKQDIKQMPTENDRDGSGITITALKEFAGHTKDAKEKAAAEIAIDHFGDLSDISWKGVSGHSGANGFINEDDIDFAIKMNHGETTGAILKGAAIDTMGSLVSGATGLLGSVAGVSELATGESIFGGAAATAVGVGWLGLGAVGIGAAGYFGYEAITNRSRVNQMSVDDQKMFKQWVS